MTPLYIHFINRKILSYLQNAFYFPIMLNSYYYRLLVNTIDDDNGCDYLMSAYLLDANSVPKVFYDLSYVILNKSRKEVPLT